jgi:hypothetical protein
VVAAIRSARSIGRPGIASLIVVQLLVAPAALCRLRDYAD